MSIAFIEEKHAQQAQKKLQTYYEAGLIPAEKKPYLTGLAQSRGPFLAVEPDAFFMDAASQIASNGLGFNASPFFGAAHFLESWTHEQDSATFQSLKQSFIKLFQRKLGHSASAFFCSSGAEANETALGQCFARRKSEKATRVLAFEGSFHGRFLISLYSTWNPAKRQLFEWDGYETVFVSYPEMKSDQFQAPQSPEGWVELWEQATHRDFNQRLDQLDQSDALLHSEIQCLLDVRQQLMSGAIFSIILEPMQCEGGERYSSSRFHNALVNLAQALEVPVIYDEVQTGFSLGREFFWHRAFDLQNSAGQTLFPDYVTCAKKAQTGVVLSQHPIDYQENFSSASLIRGYIQAMVLDQNQATIQAMEEKIRPHVEGLIQRFPEHLEHARSQGVAFAFDFKDPKLMGTFIAKRFQYGLLYYPAGDRTARFRLNLSFRAKEIEFLFAALQAVLENVLEGKETKLPAYSGQVVDPAALYHFHEQFLLNKWQALSTKDEKNTFDAQEQIQQLLSQTLGEEAADFRLVSINSDNYAEYRGKIADLEVEIYEPSRQTSMTEFDKVVEAKTHVALALESQGEFAGIAFASPLQDSPFVEGARQDPFFDDPQTLYVMDVTVSKQFQGKGLGKLLKYACCLLGQAQGIQRMQGRNRDRFAKEMWSINLSLGSYEQQHIEESYADTDDHRAAIYYSTPLHWQDSTLNLSNGVQSPLGVHDLNEAFLKSQMPKVLNKITLSNFVSESFLDDLKGFLHLLPEALQHAYTTSGQSECVDKLIKALWYKNKPKRSLLTFEGCYFGEGSFLSRSLSSPKDGFFAVDALPFPTEDNWNAVLLELQKKLKEHDYLAILAEPLTQQTMERMPLPFLKELRALCTVQEVPLLFNDTASLFYRYSDQNFMASAGDVQPDGGFAYLGGQMGVAYLHEQHYIDAPLLLISTWDGDEYSLAAFSQAMQNVEQDPRAFKELRERFEKRLFSELSVYPIQNLDLKHGVGSLQGTLPRALRQLFKADASGQRLLICPNYSAMKTFLEG